MNPVDQGYILVSDRHAAFTADHPNGLIVNDVEHFVFSPDSRTGFVTVKSRVWKDRKTAVAGEPPDGVGNASMPIPGPTNFTKNSEVENAETSALGRALAMIGYHPKETMASGEEIKAKQTVETGSSKPEPAAKTVQPGKMSETQKKRIFALAAEAKLTKAALGELRLKITGKHNSAQMTDQDAEKLIATLQQQAQELDAVVAATGGTVVEQ